MNTVTQGGGFDQLLAWTQEFMAQEASSPTNDLTEESETKDHVDTTLAQQEPSDTPSAAAKRKKKTKKKAATDPLSKPEMPPQAKDVVIKQVSPVLDKLFQKWGVRFNDLGFLKIIDVYHLALISLFVHVNKCELVSQGKKQEFRKQLFICFRNDRELEENTEKVDSPFVNLFKLVKLEESEKKLLTEVIDTLGVLRVKLSNTKHFYAKLYSSQVTDEKKQKACLYIYSLFQDLLQIVPGLIHHTLEPIKTQRFRPTMVARLGKQLPPKSLSKIESYMWQLSTTVEKNIGAVARKMSDFAPQKPLEVSQQLLNLEEMVSIGQRWKAFTSVHLSKMLDVFEGIHGLYEITRKQAEKEGGTQAEILACLYEYFKALIGSDYRAGTTEGRDFKRWNDEDILKATVKFVQLLSRYIECRVKNDLDQELFSRELREVKKLFHPSLHPKVDSMLEDCYSEIGEYLPDYREALNYQYRCLIDVGVCLPISNEEASEVMFEFVKNQLEQISQKLSKKVLDRDLKVIVLDGAVVEYRHPLTPLSTLLMLSANAMQKVDTVQQGMNAFLRETTRTGFTQALGDRVIVEFSKRDQFISQIKAYKKFIWDLTTPMNLMGMIVKMLELNFNKKFLDDWRAAIECEDYDNVNEWLAESIDDQPKVSSKPKKTEVDAEEDDKYEEELKARDAEPLSTPATARTLPRVTKQGLLPDSTHVLTSLRRELISSYSIRTDLAPTQAFRLKKQQLYEVAKYDQVYNLHNFTCTLEMIQSGRSTVSPNLRVELMNLAQLQAHLVVERGGTFQIRSKNPDAILRHSLQSHLETLGLPFNGWVATHLDAETIGFRYGGSTQVVDYQEFRVASLLDDFLNVNNAISGIHCSQVADPAASLEDFQKSWGDVSCQFSRRQFQRLAQLQQGLINAAQRVDRSLRAEQSPGRREMLIIVRDQLYSISQVPSALMVFGKQRGLSSIAQWAFLKLQFVIKNIACIQAARTMLITDEHPMQVIMRVMGRKDFNHIQAFSQRFQFDAPLTAVEKAVLDKLDVAKAFEYIFGYCTVHDAEESRSPYVELASTLYEGSLASADWKSTWVVPRDARTGRDPEKAFVESLNQFIDAIVESGNVAIKLVNAHL